MSQGILQEASFVAQNKPGYSSQLELDGFWVLLHCLSCHRWTDLLPLNSAGDTVSSTVLQ